MNVVGSIVPYLVFKNYISKIFGTFLLYSLCEFQ
jgi:hypothetical protein